MQEQKINMVMLNAIVQLINIQGKGDVLDRVRLLVDPNKLGPDAERRLDLIYVLNNDTFPKDDMDLLRDYVDWIEREFDISREDLSYGEL